METTRHSLIVKVCKAALPLYLFAFLPTVVSAQSFTQRLQQSKTGEGKVSIHQDAAIDNLVNGVKPQAATPKPAEQKPTRQNQPAGSNSSSQQDKPAAKQETRPAREAEQPADTLSQVPRRTRKVTGFRIQAYVGNSRKKAEQTGNALRTLFPNETVYVHFYQPRWICRMGNYRTYEEAKEKLDEITKLGYDTAIIVKGKVTVAY